MSRTAFLTGGTGFVGANLARELLEGGWSVRALARARSDRRNLEGLPLDIVEGDVADSDLAAKIGSGVDAVFHVAAHYSLFRADREALERSNVLGTRNLLAAARTAAAGRVVYTSSVAAIGVKSGGIADETYQSPPERLVGAYKQSKYRAEQEAVAAARGGQDVVIVNPTTPLGAWDRKPTPTGDIVVRFLRRSMPAMVETGLNFVDVRAVARGHIAAYEKGRSGERYILGGDNLAMRELLAKLAAVTGLAAPRLWIPYWVPLPIAWLDESLSPRLGRRPSIPIDGVRMSRESMYYDASKARSQLGYVPTPLDGALSAAIDWFVANGYAPAPGPASRR